MGVNRWVGKLAVLGGLAIVGLAVPSPALAHCDSMDGPVVKAAQQALETGRVELVLVWVRPVDEPVIRDAFKRTLAVRKLGGEARELADLWFFETLVRVHREGEGEPYTGLKPAGWEPDPGIAAADRSLAAGSIDAFAAQASRELADEIRRRFERVKSLAAHDPADVETGRRYVHAYVEYIHFIEELHGMLHGAGHGAAPHADGAAPHAGGAQPHAGGAAAHGH